MGKEYSELLLPGGEFLTGMSWKTNTTGFYPDADGKACDAQGVR